MLKTKLSQSITVEELEELHDKYGVVVEINDGEIKNSYSEV